jgi:hypothetical protein
VTRRLWYIATNLSILALLVVIFGKKVVIVAFTIFGLGLMAMLVFMSIRNLTGRRRRGGKDSE